MKAIITTFGAAIAITLAGTAGTQAQQVPVTQSPPPNVPQRRTPAELVLTGCIVQGSTPAVFLFDAKKDPTSAVEKAERYLLIPAAEDVVLRPHLNHVVRITGELELKVSAMPMTPSMRPTSAAPGDERSMQRVNVKNLTVVSDKCAQVG
jgi:hypothetical protein